MEGQVPAPTWAAHDCLPLQFQGHVPLKSYAVLKYKCIHSLKKKKLKNPTIESQRKNKIKKNSQNATFPAPLFSSTLWDFEIPFS